MNLNWNLSDLDKIKKNNIKVLTTFSCGGGSSMGYKLSGCTVLGCVEIDQKMMEIYKKNHNPKYTFKMAIQDFNNLHESKIPDEIKNIDILDGSPPCSVFSMSGKREAKWGNEHYFREGQEKQVLDDLFFHFINTAKKLNPNYVIAENVKGLIFGKAKGYVKEIFHEFMQIGYDVQLFVLNSAKMGVPQARERTFFIARKKSLKKPNLSLNFNDEIISFNEATKNIKENTIRKKLSPRLIPYWRKVNIGQSLSRAHPKGHNFNTIKINPLLPVNTVTANGPTHILPNEPYYLTSKELLRVQSFPNDFDVLNLDTQYITGMSVPPFMIKRIVDEMKLQWNIL